MFSSRGAVNDEFIELPCALQEPLNNIKPKFYSRVNVHQQMNILKVCHLSANMSKLLIF